MVRVGNLNMEEPGLNPLLGLPKVSREWTGYETANYKEDYNAVSCYVQGHGYDLLF